MRHPWQIWLTFIGCVAVVGGAIGWLSWKALELDRAEALARSLVQHEENVRLALWRMDSALAPLLLQESARPSSVYSAFSGSPPVPTSTQGKAASPSQRAKGRTVRIPSPLLVEEVPQVRLHFQVEPEGQFTSPEIPADADRPLALAAGATAENIERSEERLRELRDFCKHDLLAENVPASPAVGPPVIIPIDNNAFNSQPAGINALPQAQMANAAALGQGQQKIDQLKQQQEVRNFSEFQARSQYIATNNATLNGNGINPTQSLSQMPGAVSTDGHAGALTPVWIGQELLLARRVVVQGRECLQGCWLDWPSIKRDLLAGSQDLLYGADLQPIVDPAEPEH
ncbi:MAG TPA: hypothetical protein VHB77_11035, partial [Planctomycetaceae bacterium]|nr:hypothetical protein [Planctomycetaceae bacterium]